MRYIKIYFAFVSANLKELLSYRANFYSTVVTTLVWTAVSVIAVLIYSEQAPTLSGWSRQELIGLTGVFSIVTGLCYTIFLSSFFSLTEKIRKGTLDYDLIKPLDGQFTATVSKTSINNLARLMAGIVLTIIAWPNGVSIINLIKFIFLLIFACVALYGSWVILVSLNFFSQRLGNIVDFLLEIFDQMGKTPSDTLKEANGWIFTFLLPFVMTLSFPVKSLWGKLSILETGELVIGAVILFILARIFWKFSLKHYSSASS